MKKSCLHLVLILTSTAAVAIAQNCPTTGGVSPCINSVASRQFGQSPKADGGALNLSLDSIAPNLVEGREVSSPYSIAFDKTANPPILYIADTFNNRVLAYKNPPVELGTPCGLNNPVPCGVADLVIGQPDLYSTLEGGPGRQSGINSGCTLPTSVAVDASGNLYVVDSGNNRVLRFPKPFNQTAQPPNADLVIGQASVNSGVNANQGLSLPNATTLSFPTAAPSGIAIEPGSGNVWIADTNNNRVLRFPVSQLAPNTSLPTADVALGQSNLNTNTTANNTGLGGNFDASLLNQPLGIVFDQNDNLYVSDAYARVLFFVPTFGTGIQAGRILGIAEQLTSTPLTLPNQYGLGSSLSAYCGLFTNGTNLFVIDSGNNRIAEYDVPAKWPAPQVANQSPQTVQFSPPILTVYGQSGFNAGTLNQGLPEPTAGTFDFVTGIVFGGAGAGAFNPSTGDMWIADTGNNRVLGFRNGAFSQAAYLMGQLDFPYFQPNLIEGRELFTVSGNNLGGDVAVDYTANASAPHLYIADTFNNRILCFMDARNVQPGQQADMVIGQQDIAGKPGSRFARGLSNNPKNSSLSPTQTGLNLPSGVLVDPQGNLWVADSGNGRVLRFPAPFNNATPATPTVVLGQADFVSLNVNPNQFQMAYPYGLVLYSNGALAVSDAKLNRVLIFNRPAGGDFSNGQAATVVLGQASFSNDTPSAAASGLNSPRHMGVDTDDRLYVADSGNNRMVVYNSQPANDQTSQFQLNNLSQPQGVTVSGANQPAGPTQPTGGTGEIYVALSNGTVIKLPAITGLILSGNPNAPPIVQTIQLSAQVAMAVTLDKSGNPIILDSSNRAVFYYSQLFFQHGASFNSSPVAPGQLTYLLRDGEAFSFGSDFFASSYPWPTDAGDVQVTINGIKAPIYLVINEGPYIALQVPTNAPSTGFANFVVTHPSTGEVVGAALIPMQQYNPGFFTANASGTGQVAALNGVDHTLNGPGNGVARGATPPATIEFCLTGGGPFTGGPDAAPTDGSPYTGTTGAGTQVAPLLLNGSFGSQSIAPSNLTVYSGAGLPGQGCDFPGGWQITWTVSSLIPGPSVSASPSISIQMGGVFPSGPNGNALTTFTVK
jgi:uncharacterized protein (TIGR03437 family)